MKSRYCALLFSILLAIQACNAQLKCFVCDDCEKVTKSTPLEICDASYFDGETTAAPTTSATTTTMQSTETSSLPMTTEEASTVTTTTETTIVTDTSSSSTLFSSTSSSTAPPTTTTTTMSVLNTTTTYPSDLPPTPPTITTPEVPTPPEISLAAQPDFPSTPIVLPVHRARRQAIVDNNANNATDYTYHCYRIQHQVNGTSVTSRGCSRVTTEQSVCGLLQQTLGQTKHCYGCSLSTCNGTSMASVSLAALLLAAFAALLRH